MCCCRSGFTQRYNYSLNLMRHMHLTYVALHEVKWLMSVWCTQNAPRRQQFQVSPAMIIPQSKEIKNKKYKKSFLFSVAVEKDPKHHA